ncbi:MAG: hypothetical protein HKL81_03370 [Acidimicrobiaceae bacterium]|nr:hypothetical protein [Acidimicrobiaceae bacterium]
MRGSPIKVIKVGGKTNSVGALVGKLTTGISRAALGGASVYLPSQTGPVSNHLAFAFGPFAGSLTSNSVKFSDLDYLQEGAYSLSPLREGKLVSPIDAGIAKESSDHPWHLRGNIWANPVAAIRLGSFCRNVGGIKKVKEELNHAA